MKLNILKKQNVYLKYNALCFVCSVISKDLAVGDFKSGKVAIFRTRTKLRVQNYTKINGKPEPTLPFNVLEFRYELCIKITLISTTSTDGRKKETNLKSSVPIRKISWIHSDFPLFFFNPLMKVLKFKLTSFYFS